MSLTRRELLLNATASAVLGAGGARPLPGLTSALASELRPHALRQQFASGGPARMALENLAAGKRLSGVVQVQLGRETVFAGTYGLADRQRRVANSAGTQFNVASIGKMFTATALARLAEQGLVGWQDRVTDHVRGLAEPFADISIEHLLSHRAGLGSYFASRLYWESISQSGRTVADYMPIVRQDRPKFTPGSSFEYSNNGFVLLGAIIESVTGKDYYDAVRDLVFGPAGMKATAFPLSDSLPRSAARGYSTGCFAGPPLQCVAHSPVDAPTGLRGTPAGGAYSTVGDLIRFADALRASKLVRADTWKLMSARHVNVERPGGPVDGYGYGIGLVRTSKFELIGHNGGTPGAAGQLDFLRNGPLTMVVLTNLDGGQRPATAILRRAALDAMRTD